MEKIEKKGVMSVTIVYFLVLFAVLGGQSSTAAADGPDCSTYCNLCLLGLLAPPGISSGLSTGCSLLCEGYCMVNNSSLLSIPKNDQHYFCNIGCASNFCSNFLAKPDPGNYN